MDSVFEDLEFFVSTPEVERHELSDDQFVRCLGYSSTKEEMCAYLVEQVEQFVDAHVDLTGVDSLDPEVDDLAAYVYPDELTILRYEIPIHGPNWIEEMGILLYWLKDASEEHARALLSYLECSSWPTIAPIVFKDIEAFMCRYQGVYENETGYAKKWAAEVYEIDPESGIGAYVNWQEVRWNLRKSNEFIRDSETGGVHVFSK